MFSTVTLCILASLIGAEAPLDAPGQGRDTRATEGLPGSQAYVEGRTAERAAKYGTAVEAYRVCAEEDPELAPYARARMAFCRAASGDSSGALAEYRRLLDDLPAGPWSRMIEAQFAGYLELAGQHDAAAPLFQEVLDVPLAPWWLLPYQWEAAKNAVAVAATDPAVRARGFDFYRDRSVQSRYRNQREEATRELAKSAELRDQLDAAYAFVRLTDYPAATRLMTSLASVPFSGEAEAERQYVLGRLDVSGTARASGEARLEALVLDYPDSRFARDALAYLAERLEVDERHAEARLAFDRLAATYPATPEAGDSLWWYAGRLERRDEPKAAAEAYLRFARICPAHERADDALHEAGELYRSLDDGTAALAAFAELVKNYPDSRFVPSAYYHSARVLEKAGATEPARAQFRAAALSHYGDFFTHRARAYLSRLGDPETTHSRELPVAAGHEPFLLPFALAEEPAKVVPALHEPDAWVERLRFFARHGFEEAEWEALYWLLAADQPARRTLLLTLGEAGLAKTAQDFAPLFLSESEEDPYLRLRIHFPRAYWPEVQAIARETGLDPYLLLAVGLQESTFRARIGSYAGAHGVMQLMPATAEWLSKVEPAVSKDHVDDLGNPQNSLRLGAYYLLRMREQTGGNLAYALAAYNAGPGNLNKWRKRGLGGNDLEAFIEAIPFSETRDYVKRVLGNYAAYHSLYPADETLAIAKNP